VLARGRGFLVGAQNPDGGYPQQRGSQSNAQSTAWAIQGLLAAGRDPATVTREGSRSPLAYLQTLVGPDGSVHYSRTGAQTPVWVTAQALAALARQPLPIAPVSRRSQPTHAAASSAPAAAPPRAPARRAAAARVSVGGAPPPAALGPWLVALLRPVVLALSAPL
jgi:hypothetical protein